MRAAAALALTLAWTAEGSAAGHVIHISVDGLRSSYLQAVIDLGGAPNLKRFQDEGAWTIQRPHRLYAHDYAAESHVHADRPARPATGWHARHDSPRLCFERRSSCRPKRSTTPAIRISTMSAACSTSPRRRPQHGTLRVKDQVRRSSTRATTKSTGAEHARAATRSTRFFAQSDAMLPYSATHAKSLFVGHGRRTTSITRSFTTATPTPPVTIPAGEVWHMIQAIRAVDTLSRRAFQLVGIDPGAGGQYGDPAHDRSRRHGHRVTAMRRCPKTTRFRCWSGARASPAAISTPSISAITPRSACVAAVVYGDRAADSQRRHRQPRLDAAGAWARFRAR